MNFDKLTDANFSNFGYFKPTSQIHASIFAEYTKRRMNAAKTIQPEKTNKKQTVNLESQYPMFIKTSRDCIPLTLFMRKYSLALVYFVNVSIKVSSSCYSLR